MQERKAAKTQCTISGALCTVGGFLAYAQLGVCLSIHANLQPYVAYYFFTEEKASSIEMVYSIGLNHFCQSYFVYTLCVAGMLIGLPIGKKLLEPDKLSLNTGALPKTRSPRSVYFWSSLLACVCMIVASLIAKNGSGARGFWIYALLMGLANGIFSGMAYQAPMIACQLYFPDWKLGVNALLLLGLAVGIATYSCLTAHWAANCSEENGCGDVSVILLKLSVAMFV